MSTPAPSHRPLAGIRVLDLSRYLPGPFCSLQLAWLGADVIVIEQPPHGDPLRTMPPYDDEGVSRAYASLRRDCEIRMLDLQDEADRTAAAELARDADVLVESFRPGVAARLGLGVDALRAQNPGLVYASLSGYGQTGPWAQAPGHDLGYEALAGILEQSGTTSQIVPPPVPIADLAGGFAAATAICAALVRRAATGDGCALDISLTEAALAMQAMHLPGLGEPGTARNRGMLTGGLACYGAYRCSDGEWISVAPIEPKFFAALLRTLGRDDLAHAHMDPAAQPALRSELEAIFATRTAREWEAEFGGADGGDACVVRVLHGTELASHPQHAARGAVRSTAAGAMPASPYVIDATRSDTGQRVGSSTKP